MKKQDIEFTLIPDAPGVYYFWDSNNAKALFEQTYEDKASPEEKTNNILYIGKATSLRNRVRSYFDDDLIETRGLKLVNMVLAAQAVTYETTDNVMEALLLENILIKRYQPYYNTKEKDNKTYTCVVVTDEEYPRVLSMRIREYEKRQGMDESFRGKKVKVYGPFISAKDIRETLKIIRRIFPYRDRCEVGKGQPCFNAQIGLCPGMCGGLISESLYKENINNIKYLFEGKSKKLISKLKVEMNRYAKDHEFEKAAHNRDVIYRLEHINDIALINNDDINEWKDKSYRIEAYDIAHISGTDRVGVMTVIEGGEKVTSEYRKFTLKPDINDDYEGIRDLIERRMGHPEWQRPDLIVFDGGVGQKSAGDNMLIKLGCNDIQTVAVVKDDRHKAKDRKCHTIPQGLSK